MKTIFPYVFLLTLLAGLMVGCSGSTESSRKHEIQEAPPCYVQLERNGEVYEEYAVQGQVWLLFNPFVTPQQAECILAENNAKILDKEPEIGYYIVEVEAGTEGAFIAGMKQYWEVNCVYPNAIYEFQSLTTPIVMDNFAGTHGKRARIMIEEASLMKADCDDLSSYFLYPTEYDKECILTYKMFGALKKRLSLDYKKPGDNSLVINMSFGTGLGRNKQGNKRRWDDSDVTEKMQSNYINRYIDGIVGQVKYLYAYYCPDRDDKLNCVEDFVITKGACNERMLNLEVIFDGIKGELSKEEWAFFEKHYIFVSAKDEHYGVYYANDVYNGYGYHELLTKTDISDKTIASRDWAGTSFSTPRLAGYIVRAANEYNLKATEVLPFVRRATRNAFGHVVDYEMIEAEIKDFYGIYQQSPTNANTVCGHTTSTLPASLVGTKWHFTGGSSAFSYDRTFEFISTSQIRFSEVTKDLFFGGTETKEKIWDYYYDSSIDRIVLMPTNCFGDTMYMHMMYDGNAMYYSIPGMAGGNEFFSDKYQRCN